MFSFPRRVEHLMAKLGATKQEIAAEALYGDDEDNDADFAVKADLSWMND